jgi:hypothetical protein
MAKRPTTVGVVTFCCTLYWVDDEELRMQNGTLFESQLGANAGPTLNRRTQCRRRPHFRFPRSSELGNDREVPGD